MKQPDKYVCVDFDGTCVTHEYPLIGMDVGAVPVLKKLVAAGVKLILFTMRSGQTLDDAVKWFLDNDIELFGVNTNPTQSVWTESPKAYGELYIDDAALGAPLNVKVTKNDDGTIKEVSRPFIAWDEVEEYLIENGYINE